MKALAEPAAARESAEFEKRIAEMEHERRKCETEEQELAFLTAERKIAIADAKLKAIEQAIGEEDRGDKIEIAGIPNAKSKERTFTWLNSTSLETLKPGTELTKTEKPFQSARKAACKIACRCESAGEQWENNQIAHQAFSRSLISSTPMKITGSQLIETLTSVNEQTVAGLARQHPPKCHPDTFNGDPTLFHPWRVAFKAMVSDTNVSPVQEVNYLRRFTSGEVQKLVDKEGGVSCSKLLLVNVFSKRKAACIPSIVHHYR